VFLVSTLDGAELSISRFGHDTLEERAPSTQWTGGGMGPRVGLVMAAKRRNFVPDRESNIDSAVVKSVPNRYTE
jgi:hypothetical protein